MDTLTRMLTPLRRPLSAGLLVVLLGCGVCLGQPVTYAVPLSGDEEVPSRDTRAVGVAVLQINEERTEISYLLIVANIRNVIASHIHVGSKGQNGPVVAVLAGPFAAGGGRVSGVIAQGTITEEDLVGPLLGASFADLLGEIAAGNTYVNVHTNDGIDPPNTGAGDFPGGEIRGQIE